MFAPVTFSIICNYAITAMLLIRYLKMYCPPMYNPSTDPHIQIAKDYETKYKSRTADIKKYLDHVTQLHSKFEKGQMYMDEMSQV